MSNDFNQKPATSNSKLHPTDRGAISWMAHNHVAANLIMIFCIVGGLLSFKWITQEVMPDI